MCELVIGFAPGRTRTRDWLLTKGLTLEEIKAAGLVNRRGLDSFFGRVTFPLVEDGSAVNVYGRSLSENYRHMFLPARRDVIFNVDQVEGDSAILTESVIDALSLVAVGIETHRIEGAEGQRISHCTFEHIYFARPDSRVFGENRPGGRTGRVPALSTRRVATTLS